MKHLYLKLAFVFQLPFLFSCSHFFYYPDRNLYYPPEKLGFKQKEIRFQSKDGTHLYGWFFPAKQTPSKGTIVQFHGNAENISSHFLSLAWLTLEGYNLFTFDYRGYGRSEGEPDQKGTYLDGLAALEKSWELHSHSHAKVYVVYGQSLGGAIAMRALDDTEKTKHPVDLVVMDSTFLSYRGIVGKKLRSFWLTWPMSPLGSLLVSDEYSAEDALVRNKTPLLVIHDEKDPAVPFSCGEEVFEKATSQKSFWKLNGGGHVAIFGKDSKEDRDRFLSFLDNLKSHQ